MKKAVLLFIAAATALVGLAGWSSADAQTVFDGRFSNKSTIIDNGTLTKTEFTRKYNENKTGDLPAIFKRYNIDASKIGEAKEGVIHSNGNVTVDGKVVATGGTVLGRLTAGSPDAKKVTINGKTYYEKPAAHSLTTSTKAYKAATAFVFLDKNGKYTGSFMKSCGNPINAKAKPVKKEQPKKEEPKKEKPKKEQPKTKAAAECNVLEARITDRNKYTLSAEATVSGDATISAYHYEVVNSEGDTVVDETVETTESTSELTGELEPGEYTATVTVKTSEGDKTSENCKTTLVVEEEEKPVAEKIEVCDTRTNEIVTIDESEFDESIHSTDLSDCEEQPEAPAELPQTGLAEGVAGLIGVGSVIASGGYYFASRRGLIDTILQR